MKCRAQACLPLVFVLLLGTRPLQAQLTNTTRYTLLNGSYYVDDCLICGRPTIQEPLRGTFDLVLLQDVPPSTRYAIQNLNATAGADSGSEVQLNGSGTYTLFGEFAVVQSMSLAVHLTNSYTDQMAFFTNNPASPEKPFPLIEATLTQTNGNLLQTLTLHVLAAPLQEIWFSTLKPLTATNAAAATNYLSAGDLFSTTGHLIKRNLDLVGLLGIMPPAPDLGLDAVDVGTGGEVLFSLPVDVFSETLGPIQHGDLLSSRGVIRKRNQDLLAAFHPASTNDAGLDAVQVMPDGEILFSVQSNVVISSTQTLSRGDILSDQGRVYLTHQQLLANFQPTVTNYDFGLAGLRVLPSGEIWFCVEEGFTDASLGVIQRGDLLSNLGYKVFSNQDLVAAFAPEDPSLDYGLDALFVVTDTLPAKPPPRIVKQILAGGLVHFEWNGPGSAFQMQTAADPRGPWLPLSPITPDLHWDTTVNPSATTPSFFRLRQW